MTRMGFAMRKAPKMRLVKIKTGILYLFLCSLCLSLLPQWSYGFEVPTLSSPCQDEARLLTSETQRKINMILGQVREAGGPQIQVLTIDSLGGEPIESVSIQIVEKWKLGSEAKDDGLLFLISKADRKMRIEVGQGLEGTLPDVIAKRIITQVVTPFFKARDFDQGVLAGVYQILEFAAPEILAKNGIDPSAWSHPRGGERGGKFWFLIILFVFAFNLIGFLPYFSSRGSRFSLLFDILTLIAGSSYSGRGGGYRSGGGSGGGWSGGGGGFSGGGASGDW